MTTHDIIRSQYLAALAMLGEAIRACPEKLWNDESDKNRFWHIAYHTLFYTHLYLQKNEERFSAWEKHRKDYNFMGPIPRMPDKTPTIGKPYEKSEILEYYEACLKEVEKNTSAAPLDLEAPSGFEWLPFNKLELQFYNIRHIQHHAGQLIDRLRVRSGKGVGWVGMKASP